MIGEANGFWLGRMMPLFSILESWRSISSFWVGEYRYGLTLTGLTPGSNGIWWSNSQEGGRESRSLNRWSWLWINCCIGSWIGVSLTVGCSCHKWMTWATPPLRINPFNFWILILGQVQRASLTPFKLTHFPSWVNRSSFLFQCIHMGLWISSQSIGPCHNMVEEALGHWLWRCGPESTNETLHLLITLQLSTVSHCHLNSRTCSDRTLQLSSRLLADEGTRDSRTNEYHNFLLVH